MKISDLIRSLQYTLESRGDTIVAFTMASKDDFEYAYGKELTEFQWANVAEDYCQNGYIDRDDMVASVNIVLEQLEREENADA